MVQARRCMRLFVLLCIPRTILAALLVVDNGTDFIGNYSCEVQSLCNLRTAMSALGAGEHQVLIAVDVFVDSTLGPLKVHEAQNITLFSLNSSKPSKIVGRANSNPLFDVQAGALYINQIEIRDFSWRSSQEYYDALLISNHGVVVLDSVCITNNSITMYNMGAQFCGVEIASVLIRNSGLLVIRASNISGNHASVSGTCASPNLKIDGLLVNEGTLQCIDSCFENNSLFTGNNYGSLRASSEAGVIASFGVLTVERSSFRGNTAGMTKLSTQQISRGGALFIGSGLLDLKNTVMDRNNALQGGAIWIGLNVLVGIYNCDFISNSAVMGGAIFSQSAMTIRDSTFHSNHGVPTSGNTLYEPGGAAIYLDLPENLPLNKKLLGDRNCTYPVFAMEQGFRSWNYSWSTSISSCQFLFNTAQGQGNGGAIFVSNASLAVRNSLFVANQGSLGGAIFQSGTAALQLNNCSLHKNQAVIDGDQVHSASAGPLLIQEVSIIPATESSLSDISMPGMGGSSFTNSTSILCPSGYKASQQLVNYQVQFTAGADEWCLLPASYYSTECCTKTMVTFHECNVPICPAMDVTTARFRCESCPSGTYSTQAGQSFGNFANQVACSACIYGADCTLGGSNIRPLFGMWGLIGMDGLAHMIQCPPNYCCSSGFCESLRTCHTNRAGVLCGECAEGFGETFLLAECAPNDVCPSLIFYLFYCCQIAAFVVFVLWSSRSSTGGQSQLLALKEWLTLLVSYQQLCSIVIFAKSQPPIVSIMNLQLNVNLPLCPWRGMTAVGKTAFSFLTPFFIALVSCTVIGGARCFNRDLSVPLLNSKAPSLLTRSLVKIMLISFSSLTQASIALLHCVSIDEQPSILFVAGSVLCGSWWQYPIALFLILLFLFPLLLPCWHCCCTKENTGTELFMQQILGSNSCKRSFWYWPLVDAGTKLVLLSFPLIIENFSNLSLVRCACCVFMLVLHLACSPFESSRVNSIQSIFLIFVTLLALTSLPYASTLANGTLVSSESQQILNQLEVFQTILVYGSLATIILTFRSPSVRIVDEGFKL